MLTCSICLHIAVPCRAQVGVGVGAVQADAVTGMSSAKSWHTHLMWQGTAACFKCNAPKPMQGA